MLNYFRVEKLVGYLLLNPATLDASSQAILLGEVAPVVSESQNQNLKKLPTKNEVFTALQNMNLKAAPGTDGISSLVYFNCWDSLGDSLTEIVRGYFQGQNLPLSSETAMMVFGTKPMKPNLVKPGDKRRISLLHCDFKQEDLRKSYQIVSHKTSLLVAKIEK